MQEPFEQEEEKNEEGQSENLQIENEIKRMKLALEHGMDLSGSLADSDLPPEVEGQFLDYVQQWEDEYAKRKMILIYDLAERPEWKPVAEISDDDISAELERLMEVLNKNSVNIDTICEVEDRELYRFITEELFAVETNDIRIPGMMHCFIYEEFHPNHEHDIKNRCTELVEHITDKEKSDMEPWGLAKTVSCGDREFTKEELNQKLINFRDSFSSFTVHLFEYAAILINDEKNAAQANANIRYSGVIDGSNDTLEFNGECTFSLSNEYDWWVIDRFEMPGIVFDSPSLPE